MAEYGAHLRTLVVANCIIISNTAWYVGEGVLIEGLLNNCFISWNSTGKPRYRKRERFV